MGLVRRYADRSVMASSGGQSCKYSLPHEMLTVIPPDVVVVDGDLLPCSPTHHVDALESSVGIRYVAIREKSLAVR